MIGGFYFRSDCTHIKMQYGKALSNRIGPYQGSGMGSMRGVDRNPYWAGRHGGISATTQSFGGIFLSDILLYIRSSFAPRRFALGAVLSEGKIEQIYYLVECRYGNISANTAWILMGSFQACYPTPVVPIRALVHHFPFSIQ